MRISRVFALVVVVGALATVGTVAPVGAQGSEVPGVTAKEIRVGGVVGKTNPTGRPYADAFAGAEEYFNRVNKQGGLFGRKLKLVAKFDDQTRDSKNIQAVRSLVEEKKVFAVLPVATQTFAGAGYLVEKGVPTFGWNIQAEWSKGPNLFGEKGSYLCFDCPTIAPVFIAQKEGAKAAGLLAYGGSPQSANCSKGQENGFDRWGPKVAFADRSLAFGFSANDISAAVQEIKDKGVDFIATCMDVNGEVNFANALRQAGVTGVKFYAPEGYDPGTLADLGKDLDGFTFVIEFLPFELADESKEMQAFLKAMKKRGVSPSEQALAGWQNAALLVEGIKRAGKSFTQKSVVDAINQITDWTAHGIRPAIDWTSAHGPPPPGAIDCAAYVTVRNGKYVPVYNQPGKPYVCFPVNPYPASLSSPVNSNQ